MPRLRLFFIVALALTVLNGCSPAGPSATRRVAAKLNSGGTYYMVADETSLPSQLRFLLARLQPVVAPMLQEIDAPFSYERAVAEAEKFCTKIGFDRVQAFGQSSILLSGSPAKPPCFFHNRLIMDTHGGREPAPFLDFVSGSTLNLNDFLAMVPADALAAFNIHCNPAAIWRWLRQTYPLPEQIGVTIQMYAGCPPQEFFDGLSGRCFGMILPPEAKDDASLPMPRFYYEIPDRDARLFQIIAKIRMVDPDRENNIVLDMDKDSPLPRILIRKDAGKLVFASDPALPDKVNDMRKKGETLLKNPALKRALRSIPAGATSYSVENYRVLTVSEGVAAPPDEGFWSISASIIGRDGLELYYNDYVDWNGCGARIAATVLPNLAQGIRMGAMMREHTAGNSRAGLREAAELKKTLQQLGRSPRLARDGQSRPPAAPGRAGLQELLRDIPDDGTRDAMMISLVYFGDVPEAQTAPDRTPFVFERPDCWIRDKFLILFADGHLEELTMPADISSCEELVSYLHTQYRYPEKALQIFSERARLLDKELDKE